MRRRGRPVLTCDDFDEHGCGAADGEGDHKYDFGGDRLRMARTRQERRQKKKEEKVPTNANLLPPQDLQC